jgi:hypothetical protein
MPLKFFSRSSGAWNSSVITVWTNVSLKMCRGRGCMLSALRNGTFVSLLLAPCFNMSTCLQESQYLPQAVHRLAGRCGSIHKQVPNSSFHNSLVPMCMMETWCLSACSPHHFLPTCTHDTYKPIAQRFLMNVALLRAKQESPCQQGCLLQPT